MTPYYLSYAFLIACFLVALGFEKWRVAAICAFLPMFFLIAFRGLVGVDSAFYISLFESIRYLGIYGANLEPGFAILVSCLTFYFPDSFGILILLGCVTAIIMMVAALRLEREPILFVSIILPFFMFDMTMNGLRYGLAFAIVALGASGLIHKRPWIFIACTVLAASVQISSIMVAAGAWALIEARLKTFAVISVAAIIVLAVFGDYLGEKATVNAELASPGGAAGLVPYLITLAVLLATAFNRDSDRNVRVILLALFVLQTAAFILARQYYAGLRLQAIVLFIMYITLSVKLYHQRPVIKNHPIFIALFLASLLVSSALRIKNISDEQGVGDSPFAPYYFSSEIIL